MTTNGTGRTEGRTATGASLDAALRSLPQPDSYVTLGLPFSLATDSEPVRAFFRAAFARFRDNAAPAGEQLRMAVVIDPALGGPFAAAGEDVVDLSGRPMPENRAFLHLLNVLMERIEGYALVHGAAICIDGAGVILAGPPTSGKSTLVLELCRKAGEFYSDDVSPIELSTGRLHPFPRAVGIRKGAEALSGLDPGRLVPPAAHELACKWLVDPGSLGLRMPAAGSSCPVRLVVYLDALGPAGDGEGHDGPASPDRRMEIALVERDEEFLKALSRIPGIHDVKQVEAGAFVLARFAADRTKRPMQSLAQLCRSRRDIVLYLDEARPGRPLAPAEPVAREARGAWLMMELARDLLNRSEEGRLMSDCGGAAGLVSTLGRHLGEARAVLMVPGEPDRTALRILELVRETSKHSQRGS